MNTSVVTDSLEETQANVNREVWSTLPEVGYPVIPDTIHEKLLERYCYSVSYNKFTRQPNWVMWQLTGEHVIKRKEGVWNEYREDTELPSEIRSTLEDYASSGYDRGHMCPGGDCNWDDEGRDETFVLSNMCPQHPKLNRGDWKEIEMACRKWAKQYGNIYIVCGPIFLKSQQHERIGLNQIPVPEAFFKVVLCTDSSKPKGIGFICRNTDGNRKKDFYVNSIRQVERVTGYRFFPNLEDSIKSLVYDMDDINNW
ncbi:DNA/RNA non-specific endonuclease [Prevotella sp. E9-3]|uniref:DNA/RNA non-specific endonuclease n=1 Tax=Prevotella sp. E9-3 TaxID=2913621 RepID=UPI001EDBA248|nr:DNA/RNA non-specific endonuclease [Prevotella sp. E9-3]UKK47312.1 DNA/RNA non-specific endonuclease [Prevotella sp. E9-3]